MREYNHVSSVLAVRRCFLCAAVILPLVIGIPVGAQAQDKKTPSDAEKSFKKRTYDLLPIIELGRDVVKGKGKWMKTEDELICRDQHFGPRVQIRYEPPEEYDFILQFSQGKLRHAVMAMMPNPNGGSFLWKVGVQDGNDFELMSKSGKPVKSPGLLKVNTTHTTIVQVRRNFIRCLLDGKELIKVRPNYDDLMIDDWNRMPDGRFLGVGCDDPTVFHAIWITEISGPGKFRPRDADKSKKR
ncbi:MAG TPA: hypothetical protein VH643_08185 [Gemmataceae bacterium]